MTSTLFLGAQSPGGRILLESLLAEAAQESRFYIQTEDRSSHPDPRVHLIRQDWSDQRASQLLMDRLGISTVIVVAPQDPIQTPSLAHQSAQRYLDLVIPTETLLHVSASRKCPLLLVAPVVADPLDPVTLCKRLVLQSPASRALLEIGHLWPGKGLSGSTVARAIRNRGISWLETKKGPLSKILNLKSRLRRLSPSDPVSVLPMTPNTLLIEAVQSAQALLSSISSSPSQNISLHWHLVDRNSPDLSELSRNLEILSGGGLPRERTQKILKSLCVIPEQLASPTPPERETLGRISHPSPYLMLQTSPRDWSRLIFTELRNSRAREGRTGAPTRST